MSSSRIKGTVLASSLSLMRQTHGEAGIAATLGLLNEADRAQACSATLVIEWVDLDMYARWLWASAQVASNGDESAIVTRSTVGMKAQLNGVYRAWSVLTSPETVISRLDAITSTYLQGITARARQVASQQYVVSYRGILPEHKLFEHVLIGWWKGMLETCGVTDAEVSVLTSNDGVGTPTQIGLRW